MKPIHSRTATAIREQSRHPRFDMVRYRSRRRANQSPRAAAWNTYIDALTPPPPVRPTVTVADEVKRMKGELRAAMDRAEASDAEWRRPKGIEVLLPLLRLGRGR